MNNIICPNNLLSVEDDFNVQTLITTKRAATQYGVLLDI